MGSGLFAGAVRRLDLLSAYAAQLAFYLATSLVPFLALTLSLTGRWLPADVLVHLQEVIADVLPADANVDAAAVLSWARSSASDSWLTGGFVLALATSFSFMATCLRGVRAVVTGDADLADRPWASLLRAFVLLPVWVVALCASAGLLLVLPAVEARLLALPELAAFSRAVFTTLRALLAGLVLLGATWLTFWAAPLPNLGWRGPALAAAWTSLGWLAVAELFSRLATWLWAGARIAGTLGSAVLLLLWAWVNAWIFLLGALAFVRPTGPGRRRQG